MSTDCIIQGTCRTGRIVQVQNIQGPIVGRSKLYTAIRGRPFKKVFQLYLCLYKVRVYYSRDCSSGDNSFLHNFGYIKSGLLSKVQREF